MHAPNGIEVARRLNIVERLVPNVSLSASTRFVASPSLTANHATLRVGPVDPDGQNNIVGPLMSHRLERPPAP